MPTTYLDQKAKTVVKILPMNEEHLKDILCIERKVQMEPWSKQMFVDELSNKRSLNFVALVNNIIAGYLCSAMVYDELHILNIGVAPHCQRQGIGYSLLMEAVAAATKNKICAILLEVRETNLPAISLYKKAGFVKIGIRPNYYASNSGKEAAILMIKYLR